MGKHQFVGVHVDKCTGCRVCEFICSMEHRQAFNPSRSRIRVTRVYPCTNSASNCCLCDDAPCVPACPRKALTQSPETGVIIVDDELCNEPGCDKCIKACDYGSIILEGGKARICDLCRDREGGPACVEWCPEDALELTTDESLLPKASHAPEGDPEVGS